MKTLSTLLLKAVLLTSLSLTSLTGITTESAQATILKDEKGIAWASRRDLTSAQFSEAFKTYRDQGYMMIDIDAYPVGNSLRYSMIWRQNTDKRGWAEYRNLSSDAYHEKWKMFRDRNWRPLDIAAYQSGSRTLFAGIWVENRENIAWSSYRNLTGQQYGERFSERVKAGYRLVDMEAYQTSNGLRYSAIWYKNVDGRAWAQLRNMTRESYQAQVESRSAQGFMVVDYETYETSNGRRYAAIWEKKPGYAYQVRTNRSAVQYANLWRTYRDQGYRLIDFERDGSLYGGIWIENASRFRNPNKKELDARITQYRDDNNLPGISVAIIQNGSTLYRRGFGNADVANGKVAHSETIYNAASVSKVIGGTLAAKLEDEGILSNGTDFLLDLSQPTADYLPGLPTHHTHTVDQLLSHLGCVAHYNTTPSISNQTTHYATATAAVSSLWNTNLVNNCTIGSTWSYSTHAFTFVGAVLEQATGRTLKQLLQDELFDPFNLGMRVQFESSTLPYDYDRAVPYANNNTESSYGNNSWKVLGGGIETSAYQLARFGWKVLNAEILSPDARDNRLWAQVSPNSNNGLAWALTTRAGQPVAEHGGSWTGARSYLRVYQTDGLVIAIMANRTNHTVDGLSVLTSDLANIILN